MPSLGTRDSLRPIVDLQRRIEGFGRSSCIKTGAERILDLRHAWFDGARTINAHLPLGAGIDELGVVVVLCLQPKGSMTRCHLRKRRALRVAPHLRRDHVSSFLEHWREIQNLVAPLLQMAASRPCTCALAIHEQDESLVGADPNSKDAGL